MWRRGRAKCVGLSHHWTARRLIHIESQRWVIRSGKCVMNGVEPLWAVNIKKKKWRKFLLQGTPMIWTFELKKKKKVKSLYVLHHANRPSFLRAATGSGGLRWWSRSITNGGFTIRKGWAPGHKWNVVASTSFIVFLSRHRGWQYWFVLLEVNAD